MVTRSLIFRLVHRALGIAVVLLCACPSLAQQAQAPEQSEAQVPEQSGAQAPEQSGARALEQSGAQAPEESEARALFERGLEYSAQERWGEALEYFRRSRGLHDRPSSAFNMAVAQLRLGRPSDALRSLDDYLGLADPELPAEGPRRAEARRLLELAMASIARVELTVTPPHASLAVDGVPLVGAGERRELSLDPGEHRLEAAAEGYQRKLLKLSVLDGERSARSLSLERAPAPAPILVSPTATSASALSTGRRDDRGVFEEPLFWVVAATVAVAAGVGIAVLFADDGDPATAGAAGSGTGGNTGVVLQALRMRPSR